MSPPPRSPRPDAPTDEDDVGLSIAAVADAPGARARFVERFGRLVYAVVIGTRRRCNDAEPEAGAIEEVFAEVFVALFERDARRLRQWTGRCSLASWVRLVATSVSVDRMRRERIARARTDAMSLPDTLPDEEIAAVEVLERAEELAEVRRALASLPEGDHALLTMLFVAEMTHGEVAERLEITPGALYTRKNRALERLRGALREERSKER